MSNLQKPKTLRQGRFGIQVSKASFTLPATATGTLFTVTGGRIILTSIVGEVTTIIQAQANAVKLISTPTTGTAVDLCGTVDINGKEAGCLLGITGTLATAMTASNAGATVTMTPLVIPIGTIGLNTAATNTGATKWVMMYFALDDGASVA
jgi:hypothetical protein